MLSGIYKLTFKGTNLVYIGQSKNLNSRKSSHLSTLRKGTGSKLLQFAYNTYGEPTFIIIHLCPISLLNNSEEYFISLYDAYITGFNTFKEDKSNRTKMCGENAWNSIYPNSLIEEAFFLMLDFPDSAYKEISNILNISNKTLAQIKCGNSHTWLRDKYPLEYNTLLLQNRRITKVHILVSPEGKEVQTTPTLSIFSKNNGLDLGAIHNVITGKRLHHRGWKLKI